MDTSKKAIDPMRADDSLRDRIAQVKPAEVRPVPRSYELAPEEDLRLAKIFTYHAPRPDQLPRYEMIRNQALMFARTLAMLVPPGRERATALTRLEELVMHANAGIAREEA